MSFQVPGRVASHLVAVLLYFLGNECANPIEIEQAFKVTFACSIFTKICCRCQRPVCWRGDAVGLLHRCPRLYIVVNPGKTRPISFQPSFTGLILCSRPTFAGISKNPRYALPTRPQRIHQPEPNLLLSNVLLESTGQEVFFLAQ